MPTYYTYDSLPDLTASEMARALRLVFEPYTSTSPLVKWEKNASYLTIQSGAVTLFSIDLSTGSTYDIFATSFFDPSLTLYDNLGNVVSYSRYDDGDFGTDSLRTWVPDYSGTYYIKALFDQGAYYKTASVFVYEDIRSNNPMKIHNGTSGADFFVDSTELDKVDGMGGIDTITMFTNRSRYTLVKDGSDMTLVPDTKSDEADIIRSVERIKFFDETTNLDYTDVIQALYVGYFGRPADPGGFKSFQQQLTSLKASPNFSDLSARYNTDAATKKLIDSFGSSDESKALYSGDTVSFVKAIYKNILDRAPDAEGLRFWADAIDSGTLTRANASLSIMSGALSNTSTQGKADAGAIGKKIDVAANFTFEVDGENKEAGYSGAAAASSARALLTNVSAWTDVLGYQETVNAAVKSISTTRPPADAPQDIAEALAPFIGIDDRPPAAMYY